MLPSSLERVYFIGIGGYGMSALAQVLFDLGLQVSGADLKESEITRYLAGRGIKIYYDHRRVNIGDSQLVVYSTAIPGDNPEMLEARRRGVPLWHRSRLLAALIAGRAVSPWPGPMVRLLLPPSSPFSWRRRGWIQRPLSAGLSPAIREMPAWAEESTW